MITVVMCVAVERKMKARSFVNSKPTRMNRLGVVEESHSCAKYKCFEVLLFL